MNWADDDEDEDEGFLPPVRPQPELERAQHTNAQTVRSRDS